MIITEHRPPGQGPITSIHNNSNTSNHDNTIIGIIIINIIIIDIIISIIIICIE